MNPHRFTVGANYENEKGSFKVLVIKGESMLIEWDSGERITTPIVLQAKILTRMEKEASAPADRKGTTSPVWMGRTFAGLLAEDFKDSVEGTRWRSREQLGGAVTRQLASPVPFNSWSIYRRPEIHWAVIDRYRADAAWLQAKFFIRLAEDSGTYGFYIERSNAPADARVDWLSFLNWLAVESNVAWLHQTLTSSGMRIFDPYPNLEAAFNRSIRPQEGVWLVESPGSASEIIATHKLAGHLAAVEEGKWLNLVIGRKHPASELLSSGISVAAEIAADFNTLLPIYLNKEPSYSVEKTCEQGEPASF